MIVCKHLPGLEFSNKSEMFKALIANKSQLIHLKKMGKDKSEEFSYGLVSDITDKNEAVKNNGAIPNLAELSEIKVRPIINTTNLLDSHGDVHIPGIWKRSLSHDNIKLHLQEHVRTFDHIISDDALAYTKKISWKSLGFDYEGNTEALIFESTVRAKRNPFMFEQYGNGWVKNHSVGMQYVELFMCINSEERWANEYKEAWEKYYPEIVNKDDADLNGYFWAVTEAKVKEGSAVVFGSNWATPTLDNNMKSANAPSLAPADATQERMKTFLSSIKI